MKLRQLPAGDMIRIHTSDGRTVAVDLRDEEQARALLADLARDGFQASITAVTVAGSHCAHARCSECGARVAVRMSNQISVTAPRGEDRQHHFHVETVEPNGKIKGGERLVLFAGDVRLTAMAHVTQPSVRVSLTRLGRRVADPMARRAERGQQR